MKTDRNEMVVGGPSEFHDHDCVPATGQIFALSKL